MGLACSQARLLTLTARKADCEYGISIDSMQKMALTREMSELSSEYYSKLKAKEVCYYANGKYNKISDKYLMGNGYDFDDIMHGNVPVKSNSNMILADYQGRTVISDKYASIIRSVCPGVEVDNQGRGGTFSKDNIPKMLEVLTLSGYTAAQFKEVMNSGEYKSSYNASGVNTMSGNANGNRRVVDNTATVTEQIQALLDFYLPIFASAATNGWTTEYNKEMATNEDYVSDAISSGSLQLAGVDYNGNFDSDMTLTYFITAGMVETRSDSDKREEITAWYNAEKDRITEKESYIDIHMDDLSTELEAINTEIQSIQSLIDDAVSSVFDWGGG